MTTPEDLTHLAAVAALSDSVRRNAYRIVSEAKPDPVGRDEVAEALGVGRTLAAFHLDKLVAAGLLDASYARLSGRTGPGAGRPAKLYHLAAAEHAVSVPPRAYRGAAELLAEALERVGAEETLNEVARAHGRGLRSADVVTRLTEQGYEPDFFRRNRDFSELSFPSARGALPAAGLRDEPRPDQRPPGGQRVVGADGRRPGQMLCDSV